MAGERHSFMNNPVVIADEVQLHEVVPGRRRSGWDALLLERPHPEVMRVRHRRLGLVTISAADFDPALHERIE